MQGVRSSSIAVIPLAAVSTLFWASLTSAQGIQTPEQIHEIAQAESTAAPATTTAASTLNVGTQIPVVLPGGNPESNLVMAVGESVDTSFEVSENILDAQGGVVIPKGSMISGTLEPEIVRRRNGARFRASQVTVGSQVFNLQATSSPFVAKRKNRLTVNDVAGGVSTIAAATAVDSAFNRIGGAAGVDNRILGSVKRGLGIGVLPTVLKTGQKLTQKATSPSEVIVIKPNQLGLLLDAPFQVKPSAAGTQPAVPAATSPSFSLASGTRLGLRARKPGTRYVVRSDESFPITVQVANDVMSQPNQVAIPKGSLIKGSLVPVSSGSIFKASQLVIGGQTYTLNAQSAVIPPTDVNSLSPADLRGNTVTSPKASSSVSKVQTGGSSSGGGFLGQILGTGKGNQVILFNPGTTPLELGSDLVIGSQG